MVFICTAQEAARTSSAWSALEELRGPDWGLYPSRPKSGRALSRQAFRPCFREWPRPLRLRRGDAACQAPYPPVSRGGPMGNDRKKRTALFGKIGKYNTCAKFDRMSMIWSFRLKGNEKSRAVVSAGGGRGLSHGLYHLPVRQFRAGRLGGCGGGIVYLRGRKPRTVRPAKGQGESSTCPRTGPGRGAITVDQIGACALTLISVPTRGAKVYLWSGADRMNPYRPESHVKC